LAPTLNVKNCIALANRPLNESLLVICSFLKAKKNVAAMMKCTQTLKKAFYDQLLVVVKHAVFGKLGWW
jgi:hypothetical protein